MARLVARVRMPMLFIGILLFIASWIVGVPLLALAGVVLVVVGMPLYFLVGQVKADPVEVRPPLEGRWVALNSPASKVPSHGLHAYGQTYAIDFVYLPEGEYAPEFDWSFEMNPPEDYPGFGRPVLAPVSGKVVKVRDRARDHLSRDSWPGIGYFFLEGIFREASGPNRLMGNQVTIEVEPGVYAVLAHLKRGSITVAKGDRVEAGQPVAECGNSGSSTEPHLHFQLMDKPSAFIAAGLPFRFASSEVPPTGEITEF